MYQAMDLAILEQPVSMPARDGETLFLKGDPCNRTLEVRRGIARAVAYSRDGDRQILAFFFPGEFIGLPLSRTHRYSAEAVSGFSFVPHSSRDFTMRLQAQDEVRGNLATAIWQEEKAFIARSLILGRIGVQARTAAFLNYLKQNLMAVDGMLDFAIPQGDVASYLATSPETVCRTLRRFRDQGLIATPRRDRLQILDDYRLDLIAEGE